MLTQAFAATAKTTVGIVSELNRALSDRFEQHPDADIARVLGEFWDAPDPKMGRHRRPPQQPVDQPLSLQEQSVRLI